MKIKLILLGLVFSLGAKAQTTKDLFESNSYPYYWFGIDYTQVRLIGDFYSSSFRDKKPNEAIKDQYFDAWNNLVVNERSKFSVEKMFRKEPVVYDTKMIEELNSKVPAEQLIEKRSTDLTAEDVSKQISAYSLPQHEGVGVVLVAEYLDKGKVQAAYWLVVFNIQSKEILLSERFITKPSGFGVRNYWAGSFYQVFDLVTKEKYKEWKRQNK